MSLGRGGAPPGVGWESALPHDGEGDRLDLTPTRSPCLLPLQHGALALHPPSVASQLAGSPDHTVAGDEVGHGIGSNGCAYGPGGSGPSHGLGQPPVGSDVPRWDLQERLPDLELEVGASNVEGEGNGG